MAMLNNQRVYQFISVPEFQTLRFRSLESESAPDGAARVATGRHGASSASSDSSELRAPPPATCGSYRLQRPSTTFRNREGPWTTLQRHFNDNADHKDSDLSHLSQPRLPRLPRLPWLESSNRVESYLMVANEKRAFTLCIHSAHIISNIFNIHMIHLIHMIRIVQHDTMNQHELTWIDMIFIVSYSFFYITYPFIPLLLWALGGVGNPRLSRSLWSPCHVRWALTRHCVWPKPPKPPKDHDFSVGNGHDFYVISMWFLCDFYDLIDFWWRWLIKSEK